MKTLDERFDEKWQPVPWSGCFVWTGAIYVKGRAAFRYRNKVIGAYRYAFERENGPIPEGLWVLHRCDNPLCVNPCHLFLGTQLDNMRDCAQKKRTAWGERSPMLKLSADDLSALLLDDRPQADIAKQYGVCQPYISKLKNSKERRVNVPSVKPINVRHDRKLTIEQVRSIRNDGRVQTEIAKDYGVSQTAISDIKTGRRWAGTKHYHG
jgi:hypothetical protein